MARRDFRAMNSVVSLVCDGSNPGRRLRRAESWVLAFEDRFSRFRATSELSQLNRSAGEPFRASPGLFRLVQLAIDLAYKSGGLFDPTVLGALESAGYEQSFELLKTDRRPRRAPAPQPGFQRVNLDPSLREIFLPENVGLDLGGIGKGWAVDQMAKILGSPCLIHCGGDVLAVGVPNDGEKWRVAIANAFDDEEDSVLLLLRDRGIATSSSLRRRWSAGGSTLHHLIDPRTGRPSASDVVQATVIAATGAEAD